MAGLSALGHGCGHAQRQRSHDERHGEPVGQATERAIFRPRALPDNDTTSCTLSGPPTSGPADLPIRLSDRIADELGRCPRKYSSTRDTVFIVRIRSLRRRSAASGLKPLRDDGQFGSGGARCESWTRPAPPLATRFGTAPNINTLLDEHVVLKYEFVDRIFLNGYVPGFRSRPTCLGPLSAPGGGDPPLRRAR